MAKKADQSNNIGGEGERGDDDPALASEHFGITGSFVVKIWPYFPKERQYLGSLQITFSSSRLGEIQVYFYFLKYK